MPDHTCQTSWPQQRLLEHPGHLPCEQYSAFALIAVGEKAGRQYLLQWNIHWQMFNLIGGKLDNAKGDDNSLARTIRRELEEELGLRGPEECLVVRELEQVNMWQFSLREKKMKSYHFSIFEVDLFPTLPISRENVTYAARWLSTSRENIFVTRQEIESLRTRLGRPISATTRHILQAMGEFK